MRVIYRTKLVFFTLLFFCSCLSAMQRFPYQEFRSGESDFEANNLSLNDDVFKNWWSNKTMGNKLSISIGADDCKALGHNWRDYIGILMKSNLEFTDLSLEGNTIPHLGYYGIGCIAEGLKANTTLKRLDLKNCYARGLGLEYLSDAIKINKTLITLNIEGNRFNEDSANSFIESLDENQSLIELNWGSIQTLDNYISPEKITQINALLSRNKINASGNL